MVKAGLIDGHGPNLGPDGPGRAMVVLYTAGFVVASDSWWLLGLSGFTRSPGAASPGMVVVAYSPVGVGRPVEYRWLT
jgi:hypothetical protein